MRLCPGEVFAGSRMGGTLRLASLPGDADGSDSLTS
jgi:hypothetical protein